MCVPPVTVAVDPKSWHLEAMDDLVIHKVQDAHFERGLYKYYQFMEPVITSLVRLCIDERSGSSDDCVQLGHWHLEGSPVIDPQTRVDIAGLLLHRADIQIV